jgi:hypothetical protein
MLSILESIFAIFCAKPDGHALDPDYLTRNLYKEIP